ncbi:MAG: PKD domain-containing protein [Planctomycetota bacterium]
MNILDGASIPAWYSIKAFEDSRINMTGGLIGYRLYAYGNTQVDFSGGLIYSFLYAYDNTHITVSGGRIGVFLEAAGSSQVNICGGSIGSYLNAYASSRVDFSGGLIGGNLHLGNNSILTIYGSNFAVDGQPVGQIELTSILGHSANDEPHRQLTGILLNGDLIDNNFLIGDTAKIVLVPEPNPPVADAGSDQTVTDADDNGSEQVTLDGSGSSDSNGTIVSWVWTDDLGDTIPDGEITTAELSVGTHIITLTVTDDDDLTDTDTVTVTVEAFPNQAPVANADGPYIIYVGDTLTLDASGSTDGNNNIVSYLWDLDDNNSFETDAGINPVFDVNFDYLQSIGLVVDNTYNIHLKVTDSVGQSDINDSTLTIIPQPALQVLVDIKPGSCPNPVNVKSSGVLPVAILGTNDYDVTTIDATFIRLAGVEPLRSSFEDVAGPAADSNDCNCTSDGPDGFLDLTLKFKTERIVEAIGDVNEGDVLTLELTGVLIGERPIEGADCILIRGGHKPFNKADINKDGKVDCSDFAIFAQNWLQSSIIED